MEDDARVVDGGATAAAAAGLPLTIMKRLTFIIKSTNECD
jgi:hypothetical protein